MQDLSQILTGIDGRISGLEAEISEHEQEIGRLVKARDALTAERSTHEGHEGALPVQTKPEPVVKPRRQFTKVKAENEAAFRDFVAEEKTFTTEDVTREFGCSASTARKYLAEFVERKIIKVTKKLRRPLSNKGKSLVVYGYIEPTSVDGPTSRPTHPLDTLLANGTPSGPVGGISSRRVKTPVKEMNSLMRKAEKQGWRFEVAPSGHIKCYPPDGSGPVMTGGTPSRSSMPAVRKMLEDKGLRLNSRITAPRTPEPVAA